MRNIRFPLSVRGARQSRTLAGARSFWAARRRALSVTLAARGEVSCTMSWRWTLGKAVWIKTEAEGFFVEGAGGGLATAAAKLLGAGGGGGGNDSEGCGMATSCFWTSFVRWSGIMLKQAVSSASSVMKVALSEVSRALTASRAVMRAVRVLTASWVAACSWDSVAKSATTCGGRLRMLVMVAWETTGGGEREVVLAHGFFEGERPRLGEEGVKIGANRCATGGSW